MYFSTKFINQMLQFSQNERKSKQKNPAEFAFGLHSATRAFAVESL